MKIELEEWEEPELKVISAEWAKWPKGCGIYHNLLFSVPFEELELDKKKISIDDLLERSGLLKKER